MKIFFIILIFATGQAAAQQSLQLDDAVNIALRNSYDIQLARNNLQINEINNNYGVAGGLPVVTGSASDVKQIVNVNQKLSSGTQIERKGAAGNNFGSNIEGSMLLFNGMRVIATKRRLEELEKQNQEYLNASIENT